MSATIYDIAKDAGVAPAWVSKTLRNHPDAEKLKRETRERIHSAAKRLGYHRNTLAASTRTGCVNTVALIYSNRYSSFYVADVLPGMFDSMREAGLALKVFTDDNLEDTLSEIAGSRIRYVVSAMTPGNNRRAAGEFCRKYNIRLVYLFGTPFCGFPSIDRDNFRASADAVGYLAARGHKKIALFCAPHKESYHTLRHEGFLAGMRKAGLEVPDGFAVCSDDCEGEAARLLSLPENERPTACHAITDNVAVRVQNTAVLHGFKLPRDFSVIGFGNFRGVEHALSPLTTIEESKRLWGMFAVELLLGKKLSVEPNAGNEYLIAPVIVERDSVYDLRTADRGDGTYETIRRTQESRKGGTGFYTNGTPREQNL